MNEQNTEEPSIVAASPVVHESGTLPYRIVIRDLGDQHVVHTEVFEPGRTPWYHQGDYFPKRSDALTAEESDSEALRRAWARFEERVRRSLRHRSAAGQAAGRSGGHRRVDHQHSSAR